MNLDIRGNEDEIVIGDSLTLYFEVSINRAVRIIGVHLILVQRFFIMWEHCFKFYKYCCIQLIGIYLIVFPGVSCLAKLEIKIFGFSIWPKTSWVPDSDCLSFTFSFAFSFLLVPDSSKEDPV